MLRPYRSVVARTMLALICGTLVVVSPPLFAEESERSEVESRTFVVGALVIEGIERTDERLVRDLFEVEVGMVTSNRDLELAAEKLRDLAMLSEVTVDVVDESVDPANDGLPTRVVYLRVRESWSIVPTLAFTSVESFDTVAVGLRDINVLGRGIEVGGVYRQVDTFPSGAFSIRHPRLTRRYSVEMEVGLSQRPRRLYLPDGTLEGGYLAVRRGAVLGLHRSWGPLDVWVGGTVATTDYTTQGLSADLTSQATELPVARHTVAPGVGLTLDKRRTDGFRQRGFVVTQTLVRNLRFPAGEPDSFAARGHATWHALLPWKNQLSLQLRWGGTDSPHPDDVYFLGGAGDVRGFVDSRFRGRAFWLGRAELRLRSLVTNWVVLQHVPFADVVSVGGAVADLDTVRGLGLGLGLRVVLPVLRNFALRVDYARTAVGDGRARWSIGTGQAF